MTTQTPRHVSFGGANGRKRAAALLIALGPEIASTVLKRMSEDDIGRLTWEIVGIGRLSSEEREEIFTTFYESMIGRDFISVGGIEYAQEMLERAVGKERADEIVTGLSVHTGNKPFQFLQQVEPRDLVNFIQNEHPQVIALLLAYLPTDTASLVLQELPEEVVAEVSVRLAMLERTTPEVLHDIEVALRARVGSVFAPRQEVTGAGGLDAVVELLRKVDLQTEKTILEGLEKTAPDTAAEIKKRMFVFDNITLLDDRSVQRVLREIDGKDLSLALKGASEDVRSHISHNMSERAAKMLEDDMGALGPVRLRHVEEAQGRIVATIRRLEEAEEIFVMRGGEEELLV
jgi:flagellar motor switch protein FliG